jgi:hypothetical protein
MPEIIKLVNLERDHPTVNQGLLRLQHALAEAQRERIAVLKLVHGYGSSGVGGSLRMEVWKALDSRKRAGTIHDFIPGEEFRVSNEATWALLKRFPQLKQDRDLGRENRGITLAVL